MPFQKGQSGNPAGKRPGPNKDTKNAREAIARLVDGNADRMQAWLDQIAQDQGPAAAWRCMMDVIEYHVPKLARTEHVGENGGPVRVASVEWTVQNATASVSDPKTRG